jgi:hypothetical protein
VAAFGEPGLQARRGFGNGVGRGDAQDVEALAAGSLFQPMAQRVGVQKSRSW